MKKLTQEQKNEIIRLYQNSVAPIDIGQQFNINNSSVVRIIRKAGIVRNQSSPLSDQQANYIIELYNKGISSEIIANKLGVAGSTIRRILKRHNIIISSSNKIPSIDKLLINQCIDEISQKYDINIRPINYGTTYIPTFNNKKIDHTSLIGASNEEKVIISDFLFKYYRKNEFPYPILSNDELLKDFITLEQVKNDEVVKDKIITSFKGNGLNIFKHFAPHFYEVKNGFNNKPSMLEAFNNDDLLKKVISNRLEGNYNMTGNMLKQGLVNSKVAFRASIFLPHIAKYLYSQYTTDNDIIYDYSMGFGQRLLGALALPHIIKYIGVDADRRSVHTNRSIFDFVKTHKTMFNKEVDLYHMGSEEFCDPKYHNKVKFAFSSPPYWNLEKYSSNTTQAGNREYTNFLIWWKQVVNNIDKLLLPDGKFAINITDHVDIFNIKEDMCNIIVEKGYDIENEYQIQLTRNTIFNNKNGQHKYEPIIVFQRK